MKKLKKLIYRVRLKLNVLLQPVYFTIYWQLLKRKVYTTTKKEPINIHTTIETIIMVNNGKSISRFGDGEFSLILGKSIPFQMYNQSLSKKLLDILKSQDNDCLVALPSFMQTTKGKNTYSKVMWWKYYLLEKRPIIMSLIGKEVIDNYVFGDALCTRLYFDFKRRNKVAGKYFALLKDIWDGKDVLIVEGEYTRFGCNNDLLKKAASIQRIICPSKNSFEVYDDILRYIINNVNKSLLILLALGPTATCLSFDLAKHGYHAVDIGHADIEYEWYKRRVNKKVLIEGKYVNEAGRIKYINKDIVYIGTIIKSFV